MKLYKLDAAIRVVCPIDGISSNGVISFAATATSKQKAQAQAIANAWLSNPDTSANDEIEDQILALEVEGNKPRRQREAILGIDNGWLADVNAQIVALRAKLK